MSFGGTIKLTGESDYRRALRQITGDLKTMSTALKSQTTDFNANNKSITSTAAKEKELTRAINDQKTAISNAQKSYSQYSVALQAQTARHNALNREYKAAVLELDKIRKTSGEASDEYKKQAEVVNKLEGELVESTDEMDKSKRAMSDLKKEINTATKTMNAAEKEVDELGKETKETGEEAEKAKEGFTVFKGALANLASQGVTAAINGLKKLGGAVINVGKQAVESYAQYEQLTGGVETLFKDSADTVKGYADQAYKTAGMSANTYMETVTSFSASLLQGLGGDTEKAAKYADMAIIDMSDNANKMGTSIEMIQNAYQGFAKQNYTMLDNLKLGYGGTKAEMARLVKESGILGKAGDDLTAKNLDQKVSFDQIVKAINVVQKRMGITGTTAKEASSTIEGSVNSMKASWSNLLTAIADDNADLKKSVNEFVDSAITAGNNLVPRVKQIANGVKNLINGVINEVFPKLKREIPQLAPLIDTFEWFIDHKSLVVGAIGAMVGAFAVSKVVSYTKSMSDATKGVIDFVKNTILATTAKNADTAAEVANTGAKVAGTAATGALAAAQNALNAAWAANPVGVVVAGIAALVGVIALASKATNQMTDEEKAQQEQLEATRDEINRNKEAWKELEEAQQQQINAGMTEISHLQTLWDELQGIVDQNGKVKKGYEERANFITSRLSEATGIEIKNVDGVIQKYGDLKKSIDEVMEKKKAQIILDSQESLYKKAIEEQDGALKNLQTTQQNYYDKKAELTELENKLEEAKNMVMTEANASYVLGLQKNIEAKKEEVGELEKDYKKQEDLYGEYAYNIGQYEQNLALFHAGKYGEMTQVNWDYVKEYQGAEEAEKKLLEDKISTTQRKLSELEKLRDGSNSKIYDSQINAAKKELSQLQSQLKQYNSATKQGTKQTEIIWSNSLAEQLSELTGHKVEFKNAGKGNVQMVVDGEKVGAPKAKKEMAKLTTDAIKEITKKDKDAKKAGEDLIDGVNNGVKNENKQSSVFTSIANFGSKLLGKLRASLKEKSPSKATEEMGGFLLEGLNIGMAAKEASTLKQAAGVGRSVINAISGELSRGASLGKLNINANIPTMTAAQTPAERRNVNSFDNMVSAFKTALSEMKIELDDEVAGEFVERTVTRVVYS